LPRPEGLSDNLDFDTELILRLTYFNFLDTFKPHFPSWKFFFFIYY
jgi:hypothetical protein